MKKKIYYAAIFAMSTMLIAGISSCGSKSKTETEETSTITSHEATEEALNGEWASEMVIPQEGYRSNQEFFFDASNHNFTYIAENSEDGMIMNLSGTWSANEDYIQLNFESKDQAKEYRASIYEDLNKALNKTGNTETIEIMILCDGTLTLKYENGEIETFNSLTRGNTEKEQIMQDMSMIEQQQFELAE